MHREVVMRCFSLFALVVLATVCHAQELEVRISRTDTEALEFWPVRMAVAEDGSVLVNWSNGSQLLAPDGQEVGDDLPYYGVDGHILWIKNMGWAFLTRKDSSWSDGGLTNRTIVAYFLLVRDPWVAVDSTDTLLGYETYSDLTYARSESPYRFSFSRRGERILCSWNTSVGTSSDIRWQDWTRSGYTVCEGLDIMTRFIDPDSEKFDGFPDPDVSLREFSSDGGAYTYRRILKTTGDRSLEFSRFNDTTADIDTILALDDKRNLSEMGQELQFVGECFIPYGDDRADILYLRRHSDTLIARRYDFSSGEIEEIPVLFNLRRAENPYFGRYEIPFAHVQLPSGKHLLSWGRKVNGENSRVYIAAFGTDWQQIGEPYRVSSSNKGEQILPAIAVHNDSISVAWMDSRDQKRGVYYKRIPMDRVLSAHTSYPPADLDFEAYPNPVSVSTGLLTVSLIYPVPDRGSLRVFDNLGREVRRIDLDRRGTQSSVRIDLHGISPGLYFLLYENGKQLRSRSFIIR